MGSRGFPSARLVALDLKDNADTEPLLSGGLGLIRWGGGLAPDKKASALYRVLISAPGAAPLGRAGREGSGKGTFA
mgnify:CR=1 FL=1